MKNLLLTMLLCSLAISLQAYTIDVFAGSVYNTNTATMDAALGIDSSFTIEDFEDTTLIDGLSVQYTDGSTTPHISTAQYYWDGSKQLENYSSGNWKGVRFLFDNPVTTFAVGTSYFDTSNGTDYIYLNGSSTALTNLESYSEFSTGSTHNLYIIISAEAGDEAISEVFFPSSNNGSDRIDFDHLAIQTNVPEASTIALCSLSIIFLLTKRRLYKR